MTADCCFVSDEGNKTFVDILSFSKGIVFSLAADSLISWLLFDVQINSVFSGVCYFFSVSPVNAEAVLLY